MTCLWKKVDLKSKTKLRWGPSVQISRPRLRGANVLRNSKRLKGIQEHRKHLRAKTRKTTSFLDIFLFNWVDKVVELQVLRDGDGEWGHRQYVIVSTTYCGEGKHLNCIYNIWENLESGWKRATRFRADSESGCRTNLDTTCSNNGCKYMTVGTKRDGTVSGG